MIKKMLAIVLLFLPGQLAADKYCVSCAPKPQSMQGSKPFMCESTTGGEFGRIECGLRNSGCQITFYDGRFCGPDSCTYNFGSLKSHVKWCIFHEGCAVWNGEQQNPSEEIKSCCFDHQTHNDEATCQLKKAPLADFEKAVLDSVNDIPGEFQVPTNFRWVCEHEGQGGTMHALLAQGNIGGIRGVYHHYQKHNPNARNLLAALKDSIVRQLTLKHCPK